MNELAVANTLVISQKKEWGEIVSGFETKNRYAVFDEQGNMLYDAQEKSGSFLLRMFLKALRPFSIVLSPPNQTPAFLVERPFRFYFHKIEVKTAEGKLLGSQYPLYSTKSRVSAEVRSWNPVSFVIWTSASVVILKPMDREKTFSGEYTRTCMSVGAHAFAAEISSGHDDDTQTRSVSAFIRTKSPGRDQGSSR